MRGCGCCFGAAERLLAAAAADKVAAEAEAAAADKALTAAIALAAVAALAAALVVVLGNPAGGKRIGMFTDSVWSCMLLSWGNDSIAIDAFATTLCCDGCDEGCCGGACEVCGGGGAECCTTPTLSGKFAAIWAAGRTNIFGWLP